VSEQKLEPQVGWNGKPPGTTSWDGSVTEAGTSMRSYYGRPVIKPPVWQWEIPVYFFTGGLAGAAAVLSAGARLGGNRVLARRMAYAGAVADAVSPVLLMADLGRPERFLNMLRVFKITSPMSVGSWILTASSATSIAGGALEALGLMPRAKLAAQAVSTVLGPPMTTYTAVLIADTAVPAWHEARHELPFVFALGSAASAGAVGTMIAPARCAGPARRLAIGGVAGGLVAEQVMEKRLGLVGEPYSKGLSGKLMKASKALAATGAALVALGGKQKPRQSIAGASLIFAGEVLLRWGVFKAGDASARDPRFTVEPQRERADQDGSQATSRGPVAAVAPAKESQK